MRIVKRTLIYCCLVLILCLLPIACLRTMFEDILSIHPSIPYPLNAILESPFGHAFRSSVCLSTAFIHSVQLSADSVKEALLVEYWN